MSALRRPPRLPNLARPCQGMVPGTTPIASEPNLLSPAGSRVNSHACTFAAFIESAATICASGEGWLPCGPVQYDNAVSQPLSETA
jgi:hypothetical protein